MYANAPQAEWGHLKIKLQVVEYSWECPCCGTQNYTDDVENTEMVTCKRCRVTYFTQKES